MLDYIAVSLPSQGSSEMALHLASYTEQKICAPQEKNGTKWQIRNLNVVSII